MSLRLRLIVAFFLISVVPLAAVTFYSSTSNRHALQVAAQRETEMLTGDLTQRMQVVTSQISERVQHLMDIPALVVLSARGSADEVLARVEQGIPAFRGHRDLFDDATMMAVTVG